MARCKHCGAALIPLEAVCDYCGSSRADAPPPPDPVGAAFARLAAHPELESTLRSGPREPAPAKRRDRLPVGWFVFLIAGGFILKQVYEDGGPEGPARYLVPAMVVVPLILAAARRRDRSRAFDTAPLESFAARVGELGRPTSNAPRPHAVIESSAGGRRKLRLTRQVASEANEGDYGVAFVKGDVLVDFRRLRV